MTSYTALFGGNPIYASDVSYLALDLDEDTTLEWALEANPGPNVVARIIDVTPGAANLTLTMPPADETSVGQLVQFKNLGSDDFDVVDNDGGAIITLADGEIWTIYLTDNSDAAGEWTSFQAGSVLSQAQAASLAGFGLVATGSTLSQEQDVSTFSMDYTAGAADRAKAYVWTGGLGTLTLTAAGTLGNGWFFSLRNAGTGNLTVDCSGADTINGEGSITLRPEDSCTINCDGTSFYTVGLGQNPIFAFDYTSIDLTGAGATYTLSGAELNRIAYRFFGVIGNNVTVIVPATTQQYWIANDTTGGSFTVGAGTATQVSPVIINRAARGIYYCQGSEVVHAETASVSTPIAIVDGGTGATTASGARINLGGTATGIAVFTASSQAAGRTALAAAASGANTDITGLTGLTNLVRVNASGSSPPAVIGAGTLAQIVGAAGIVRYEINSFAGHGIFVGRRANGTAAAPSALLASDPIAALNAFGYGATGYSSTFRGGISFSASENWTDSAQGTQFNLDTTPNGATTAVTRWVVTNDGHLIPNTDSTYDIGTNAVRIRTVYADNIDVAGGVGTVTSVSGSGGTTGLTLTGGPITGAGTLTIAGTLIVANGGTGATTLTGILKGNGTSAFTAATAGSDYVAPGTATNFTAKQTFTGAAGVPAMKIVSALEKVTIVASAPTGTINFDLTTQSDLYWTTNASANWTLNLRGDGSNTLDSLMATGESWTAVFRTRQGGTAYYNNVVQVDGTTSGVTTIWIGAAPTAGIVSARNIYTYNILKTGSAAFEVTASLASAA